MGSHDTGIYLNTNSTESSFVHQYNASADTVSPVCQPSEISTPVDDNVPDSDEVWQDVRTCTSFEKTSSWLLQQDNSEAVTAGEEAGVDLEHSTKSNICIDSESADVKLISPITASHSEPVLLQNAVSNESDIGMARSSMTVIASMPSEQAFVDRHLLAHVSAPDCSDSSRQKTRQLRFSCAVAAMENYLDSEDSDVDNSRTFPSKDDVDVATDADGRQWVTNGSRNDAEELSVEDGPSLANSNTSLSDTCNSSFKSSTEDLANLVASCVNESSMPAGSSVADVTPRVSNLRSQHSPALRHRKRRTLNDSQQMYNVSPARHCEHVSLAEEGNKDGGANKICQECGSVVVDSAGGVRQSADATATVNELQRAVVTSDDDDDDSRPTLHISPSKCRLHPRHVRRPCSARVVRSSDKFSSHNATAAADVLPKDRGVHVEGRRSNVRIMDVRLLESTGISSADSDAEAARLSAAKSASTPKASNAVVLF